MTNEPGLLSKWIFHLGMAIIQSGAVTTRKREFNRVCCYSIPLEFILISECFRRGDLTFNAKDFQEENTASFVEGGRGGAGLNFMVRKQLLSELFRSAITAYKVVVMKMQQITMDYPPPFVCIFIVKDLLWHSASKRRIKAVCNVCRIAFSLSL